MKIQILLLTLLAVFSVAATPVPQGWREPSEKEAHQDWRRKSPTHYLSIIGDFNGDGSEDQARLLVKESGEAVALFVLIGKSNNAYKLDELEDITTLDVMGIDIAPTGNHKTACGKGYLDCEPGEPKTINLKSPGIDYFRYESANSFFIWNEKNKGFDRVWISD